MAPKRELGMAIPLRVVQKYRMDGDEKVWLGYELQLKTNDGWVTVPVVEQEEVGPVSAAPRSRAYKTGIMEC